MRLQAQSVCAFVLSAALLLVGCRPLQQLIGHSPNGSDELEAARSLGNDEIEFSDSLRSRFQIPAEINSPFEAREWLLRRANEIGTDDVRVSARFLLAAMVAASDCAEAERILEQNADDRISQEFLVAMRREGCETRLRRWIEESEARFKADPSTRNEMSVAWLVRSRRQLERIEAERDREGSERP